MQGSLRRAIDDPPLRRRAAVGRGRLFRLLSSLADGETAFLVVTLSVKLLSRPRAFVDIPASAAAPGKKCWSASSACALHSACRPPKASARCRLFTLPTSPWASRPSLLHLILRSSPCSKHSSAWCRRRRRLRQQRLHPRLRQQQFVCALRN